MSQVLLAIDTATEAFSVALSQAMELRELFTVAPRQHASCLLPMVDDLLGEAGFTMASVDAIVVTRGPGSFTGVRIGIAAAQGLALGADKGLIPVSTLQSLALNASLEADQPRVAALLDARMNQVYAGAFEFQQSVGKPVIEEQVCNPTELTLPAGDWLLAGPGAGAYGEELRVALGSDDRVAGELIDCYPSAKAALHIARELGTAAVAPEAIEPAYLRAAVR
ncbi:MAG: tRNA (adenosine(37)-N6)-threonylcarbamoyltransferase complex dimerization subunit type 1 TsaB [Pseudomonadota bacterium]